MRVCRYFFSPYLHFFLPNAARHMLTHTAACLRLRRHYRRVRVNRRARCGLLCAAGPGLRAVSTSMPNCAALRVRTACQRGGAALRLRLHHLAAPSLPHAAYCLLRRGTVGIDAFCRRLTGAIRVLRVPLCLPLDKGKRQFSFLSANCLQSGSYQFCLWRSA